MSYTLLCDVVRAIGDLFAPAWVDAALVLALFSTLVTVGVFGYLNRFTRQGYFSLWTVAWMFYASWLAACIGLNESPDVPFLIMARRACIGISALFMFWGSLEFTTGVRRRRELGLGVALILIWSYVAAFRVRHETWITLPVFVMLSSASICTGLLYFAHRKRYRSAILLAVGFILWGLHLLEFPFQSQLTATAMTLGYFASAVLAAFIAMGMTVQVLEQARERNETLLDEFKKGVATRRLLEQEVSVSERKYRALFDTASDAIFLVDLETLAILEANESAKRFVGRAVGESATLSFADLCPNLQSRGNSLLDHKRMFDEVFCPSKEFQIVRPNGQHVLCEGSVSLVQYNKRPVLQINVREITERKKLEQQLRQSEKLSALGQLIAGVAHELNNPLAVVMGYAQLFCKGRTADPKVKDDMFKILRECERAAKIVRNLLTFARPRDPQMMPVDLNQIVRSIVETHEGSLVSDHIELKTHLAPNLPRTMADPHQIEQVITNLLMNAIHAMSECDGPRVLEVATEAFDKTVRASVADSGPGIAPEILSKIFDPFFTTKAPGKGTGLGLSISHSIIEEHRGRIWVQSERGKGAKFLVELPLVPCMGAPEPLPQAVRARVPAVLDPNAVQFRLLIVDDEPGIVEVLKSALGEDGYTIETAATGDEALQRIASNRYDLIISDLCMPNTDGEALYRAVGDCYPELAGRIIFVTGDTVSTETRSFFESTCSRYVAKPFKIEEIKEVIRQTLEAPPH